MPKADLPAATGEPLDPARADAAAAQERRTSERLITDWEGETRRLGHALALMTLDVSAMTGPRWAYRFVIAVSPTVEGSSFLFYGDGFASLLELPERRDSLPTVALLPARYVPVFAKGCIASTLSAVPVRMQGAVEREDGRHELYRAAFVRLSLDASRQRHLTLGAFNRRVADPRAEHPNARASRSVNSTRKHPSPRLRGRGDLRCQFFPALRPRGNDAEAQPPCVRRGFAVGLVRPIMT